MTARVFPVSLLVLRWRLVTVRGLARGAAPYPPGGGRDPSSSDGVSYSHAPELPDKRYPQLLFKKW